MPVQKTPSGTRGARTPPHLLNKIMSPLMVRIHRLSGDRTGGMDLLYLTTVGARSGERRTAPVARFDDGQGGWIIVASAGGAAQHPGWYHNIAAHPDQVWAEVSGTKHRVEVDQLQGEARDRAWTQVTDRAPRFKGYLTKTDRELPLLRLTPVS
jgi:deazaflavin-dependent oxidoreductase (nitroreductase family)